MRGVVTGKVKDLADPHGEGRVKVEYSWLPGRNISHWAPIATFLSGGGRGSWFMPEVGDEVLVAFNQGEANHPYVVGCLWNGKQHPPHDGIDTKVRRLRTVSGHVLEFDDRPGREQVRVESAEGQKITLKDRPAGEIRIQTKLGNEIVLTDTSFGIQIKTAGTVTVNAPLARFSGAVKTPLLLADAVVGKTYTPGPGNFFGL